MMILMDQITDKPNWQVKVFDEIIVMRWKEEAATQSEEGIFKLIMRDKMTSSVPQPTGRIVSDAVFDYCILELREKARYYSQTGFIPTFDIKGFGLAKSDTKMTLEFRQELVRACDVLLQDQKNNVDWNPNSDEMVQDLIHPSLYPFIYGQSPLIEDEVIRTSNAINFMGRGMAIEPPASPQIPWSDQTYQLKKRDKQMWSENYQLLPSNVAFEENGGGVRLTSYINNVHPVKYNEIYRTIETAITLAIPLWEQCMIEYKSSFSVQQSVGRETERFARITKSDDEDFTLWTPPFDVEAFTYADIPLSERDEASVSFDEKQFSGVPPKETDEDREWRENKLKTFRPLRKWWQIHEPILPEPLPYQPVDYEPKTKLRDKFADRGLQIIVKMASIELTPDKPEFPSGGWHLEGQMNEKICATAILYFDSDNVTDTHLSLRTNADPSISRIKYPQDSYNYLERVFGTSLRDDDAALQLQTFGDVKTPQGRLLAFPNTFQHRVSSFRLQDTTKPGHRRFLVLWLIDPHRRIISTANVPPQQRDWWPEDRGQAPSSLITLDVAKEHRLKLMQERSVVQTHEMHHPDWDYEHYSFCEH